eukprot:584091-Rhodomonas_salina.1
MSAPQRQHRITLVHTRAPHAPDMLRPRRCIADPLNGQARKKGSLKRTSPALGHRSWRMLRVSACDLASGARSADSNTSIRIPGIHSAETARACMCLRSVCGSHLTLHCVWLGTGSAVSVACSQFPLLDFSFRVCGGGRERNE